jgi:hypothetical protein
LALTERRTTACDGFRRRYQVGFGTVVLHGEQLAGAAEPRLHFIGNEQDAVSGTRVVQWMHQPISA